MEYICKDGSRIPIPLSAALAEVEEAAELLSAALTETVPPHLVLQNLLHQLLACIRQVMDVDTVAVLLQTENGPQLAVHATLGL